MSQLEQESALLRGVETTSRVYVAFTGNSQSMFFASAFATIPTFESGYFGRDGQYIAVEGHCADVYNLDALPAILGKRRREGFHVVLCEQTSHRRELIDEIVYADVVDDIVRFPLVQSYCFWPPESLVSRSDPARAASRMLRLDRDAIVANEVKAEFGIVDFIEEKSESHLLFDAAVLPSPVLLAELVRRLASCAAFVHLQVDVAAIAERVGNSRGFNAAFDHPVSVEITNELRCNWAQTKTYQAYRACTEAMAAKNHRQASKLLADFSENKNPDDPLFWRMVEPWILENQAAICEAVQDYESADALRESQVAHDPTNMFWRTRYAENLMARGESEKARLVLQDVIVRSPRGPAPNQFGSPIPIRRSDEVDAALATFDAESPSLLRNVSEKNLPLAAVLERFERGIQRISIMAPRLRDTNQVASLQEKLKSYSDSVKNIISVL